MFLELTDRNIIPRWRNFQTTAALGQLDSPPAKRPMSFEYHSIAERIQDFKLNPTPWVASDLVSAAFVVGRREQAVEAAKFIIQNQARCPPASVWLAERTLNPASEGWVVADVEESDQGLLRHRTHTVRMRLRDEPRNSIKWVELARLYTILGQREQAKRAMRIACVLSPSNRYVLRAAARLFAHHREAASALRILRSAESVRVDPWVLAAEVGLASVAGVTPRFAKLGFALIGSGALPDSSISELASSLATLEMQAGSGKKAKKYFRRSLVSPTENSVAQAEWATTKLPGLEVDVGEFEVARPFEAQAYESFHTGRWAESVERCRRWHWDEPFSSRPAILASYVSSGTLEKYDESIAIIKNSVAANPREPALMNNLAFALASMGRIEDAEEAISDVDESQITDFSAITLTATRGLICFRKGLIEPGRHLYLEAMDHAKRKGIWNYRAIAAAYLAREEILAGTEESELALRRAVQESRGQKGLDLLEILNRVLKMAAERRSNGRAR